MSDQRNTFIAIVLSLAILLGWQTFFAPKHAPKPRDTSAQQSPAAAPAVPAPTPPGGEKGAPVPAAETPAAAAPAAPRLPIHTAHMHGSIALTGLRFDDVTLANYHETPDPKSPEIVLLSPASAPKPYYAEEGWISSDPGLKLPGPDTVWTPDATDAVLTENTPVTVSWDNGEGLRFIRVIHADKDYMFTTEQTVENKTGKAVTLYPYALVARLGMPDVRSTYILHEGPLGVFNRTLKEIKYKDLKKDGDQTQDSVGGWIGMTDKYWLTAVAFDQAMPVTGSFKHNMSGDRDRFQTDLRGTAVTLQPGESKTVKSFLFAGAKRVQLLDAYAKNLGISRFDLAIDFGWFYFLTKPFFYALLWLKGALGNFGLAILAFTTLLRLLMFPIAGRQYKAMNKLKALQPEMKRLQERYANDRTKLNQALMELYKREKANPVAGCLPVLIQIPIFFALYKVLYNTIEMRHAPFYGWIHDLSAPDPTTIFNLFGLLPFTPPHFLHLGALPIIMGISMWLQQRLAPQPTDPMQAKIMMFLPVMFTFMLASFPSGLVIYYTCSNLLGILQQWLLTQKPGTAVKT
jgi:YidC/Oxa1 family membrane protein insertase